MMAKAITGLVLIIYAFLQSSLVKKWVGSWLYSIFHDRLCTLASLIRSVLDSPVLGRDDPLVGVRVELSLHRPQRHHIIFGAGDEDVVSLGVEEVDGLAVYPLRLDELARIHSDLVEVLGVDVVEVAAHLVLVGLDLIEVDLLFLALDLVPRVRQPFHQHLRSIKERLLVNGVSVSELLSVGDKGQGL